MKNTVNKQVKDCLNRDLRRCKEGMIMPVLLGKIGGRNGRS